MPNSASSTLNSLIYKAFWVLLIGAVGYVGKQFDKAIDSVQKLNTEMAVFGERVAAVVDVVGAHGVELREQSSELRETRDRLIDLEQWRAQLQGGPRRRP